MSLSQNFGGLSDLRFAIDQDSVVLTRCLKWRVPKKIPWDYDEEPKLRQKLVRSIKLGVLVAEVKNRVEGIRVV